jgi:hypothetical protein
MDTGVGLVLGAGAMSFGNEWLQTGKLNFRVPVATLVVAMVDGVISDLSPKGGIALGVLVFIGALTVPLNGKSPIDEFNSQFAETKKAGK